MAAKAPRWKKKKYPSNNINAQPIDLQRAAKLHKCLHKQGLSYNYDQTSWARRLATLSTATKKGWKGLPNELIDSVLDWYIAHAGQDGVPAIWSAVAFTDRFGWLKDEMERDHGPFVKVDQKTIAPILDNLAKLYWPKCKPEDVPRTVQLSYNRYLPFYRKSTKFIAAAQQARVKADKVGKWCPAIPMGRFANRLAMLFVEPVLFITWWMKEVNSIIDEWEDWHGKLHKAAWRPDHKWFHRWFDDWCSEGAPDDHERWFEFLEAVG